MERQDRPICCTYHFDRRDFWFEPDSGVRASDLDGTRVRRVSISRCKPLGAGIRWRSGGDLWPPHPCTGVSPTSAEQAIERGATKEYRRHKAASGTPACDHRWRLSNLCIQPATVEFSVYRLWSDGPSAPACGVAIFYRTKCKLRTFHTRGAIRRTALSDQFSRIDALCQWLFRRIAAGDYRRALRICAPRLEGAARRPSVEVAALSSFRACPMKAESG